MMLYNVIKAATYLFIGVTCAMFWIVCMTDPSIAWPPIERGLVIILVGILFGINIYLLVVNRNGKS